MLEPIVARISRKKPGARRAGSISAALCATASLGLVTYASSSGAQVPAAELPGVVVTGSRLPTSASGLAQNVTVIGQREIQETNPARIEDILARVTGAYVDQAGKTGGFASLYMRGAENSHLLIMLDGVKLNDPTTTRGSAYDLSSIDISTIERIEVLRGPASAVYGGEALAGVVHIITKRAVQPGVSGSAYAAAGGDHHLKLGGTVSFGQDALRAQVGAGHTEEGSSGSDASLRLNTLSGSLRFAPGGTLEGEVFASHVERKSAAFPDDSGGPRLAAQGQQKTVRDSTDQSYGFKISGGDSRSVRVQGGVSVFDRQEHADNAFIDGGVRFPVPAFVSDTQFKRTDAVVTATHEYGTSASVLAGLEHQIEDGSLTSVGDFFGPGTPPLTFQLKRKTTAVFTEGRIKLGPSVAVQIGVRHDKVLGLKAVTTPHLGLVWDVPGGATTLKANYNEGFKPPSFFALGFPIGANPDLRPERSKNFEVTVAHQLEGGSSVQFSGFRINYKDLVDFDGATFTNINRGSVVVTGVEPTMKLQFGNRWRAQVGLTLLNIDERDGLQPLRNRPENKATASVVYDIDGRSTVFAAVNHTGKFLDRSNPTGDISMSGFTVVDAGYSIQFGTLRVKLSVDNLLDKNYEQFVGFAAQGRRLRVELRATL